MSVTPTHHSLFSTIPMAAQDPILGLNEQFNADPRSTKVNLGVGVYFTEEGKIPLLRAVAAAEKLRFEAHAPRGYLPIDGIAAYNMAVQNLLFGADSSIPQQGCATTVQTLGGTGALKIGADFIKEFSPNSIVAISDPSWENHRALFEGAGFPVQQYPYYDATTHGLNFPGMLEGLAALPERAVVVLHACCHNPTGVDLSPVQWQQIVDLCKTRKLIPFLDMAYQGFAENLTQDSLAIRLFADSGLNFFVASSFSKSFSLYGERVGALTIVGNSKEEASRVLSQAKRVIRTNYSTPPTHGAAVVATVLNTPELRKLWEEELEEMRGRIKRMRNEFVAQLEAKGVTALKGHDFKFVTEQRGMFSYSGLTATQIERLRKEFGIYAVSTGRICIAALNSRNIGPVVEAITAVL